MTKVRHQYWSSGNSSFFLNFKILICASIRLHYTINLMTKRRATFMYWHKFFQKENLNCSANVYSLSNKTKRTIFLMKFGYYFSKLIRRHEPYIMLGVVEIFQIDVHKRWKHACWTMYDWFNFWQKCAERCRTRWNQRLGHGNILTEK